MRNQNILRFVLLILCLLMIIGYGLFQARKVIEGPRITLESPQDGAIIQGVSLDIRGKAENVAFLYLNGRKIYTDMTGIFDEHTIAATGTNVIELRAVDKFGNEIRKIITIFREK